MQELLEFCNILFSNFLVPINALIVVTYYLLSYMQKLFKYHIRVHFHSCSKDNFIMFRLDMSLGSFPFYAALFCVCGNVPEMY